MRLRAWRFRLVWGLALLVCLGGMAGMVSSVIRAQGEPTMTPNVNWVNVPVGINVRAGPGFGYGAIGALPVGAWIQPLGRSPDGNWILISYLYTQGWVWVDGVSWRLNPAALPVIAVLSPTPIPRPFYYSTPGGPTYTPNANWVDVDLEGGFVRAGPGRGYAVLGSVFTGDVVDPVARNVTGNWVMIRYGDGYGWIRSDLVAWVNPLDSLPVVDEPNLTPSFTPVPARPVVSRTPTASATRTPFPADTATLTATVSPAATPTALPSATPSVTRPPSLTPTTTASRTPSLTPTATLSPTVTASATASPTATATRSPSPTVTPTVRPAQAATRPTVTARPSVTATVTATATLTPTPRPTETATPQPTATSSPTATPLASATATLTPILRPTETATPRQTATVRPSATAKATVTPAITTTALPTLLSGAEAVLSAPTPPPSATATPSASATPAASPSTTLTRTPSPTVTASATSVPTSTPTPSRTPSRSPAATATVVPSPTASVTPVPSATPTAHPSATPTATPVAVAAAVRPDTETLSPAAGPPGEADQDGPGPLWLAVGGVLGVLVAFYVAVYVAQAANLARYREGFVVSVCPICARGTLYVEERRYRVLGIPRVRRVVRCTGCRSVLRQVGPGRWRYAVDAVENPAAYEALNNRVMTEPDLLAIAPELPPAYIEGDET